jgi:transcriptional regulator with XRE-family HTH domain
MSTIGEKICEIRKRKGLTQEELSKLSNINLRTLQRIEKGETDPLGNTLKSICKILDISIEDLLDFGKTKDIKVIQLLYASVLSFLIIPLGNIIIPLILWITKRDKIIDLNKHGLMLLRIQILWTLLFSGSIFTFAFLTFQHLQHRIIPLCIAGFLAIVNVFYSIIMIITISGLKSNSSQ